MKFLPVQKPYFSQNPALEKRSITLLWAIALISALVLLLAWPGTRSVEFIAALQQLKILPVEILFRVFTFLGDDQFFMIFFSILIWSVDKSLGFWSAMILLTSATYSNLIKDITLLERPPLPGVEHPPGSYAFPSGHTLTAVTVWFYLAVRLQKKSFWIWSIVAVAMIGVSRLVLGYHFLGDVLGGLAFGIPFLLLFLWLSSFLYKNGWLDRFSTPLLLAMAIIIPLFLVFILPGADPPKLLGYLAGASCGYIIEKIKLRTIVKGTFVIQAVKAIVGLAVLFGIIIGLGGVLPSAVTALGFIRYGLGGLWVTLGAPALFLALKLTAKEG